MEEHIPSRRHRRSCIDPLWAGDVANAGVGKAGAIHPAPLDHQRARWLRQKNGPLIDACPTLDDLRTRLLAIGGQEVVYRWPEFDLDELLARGRKFSAKTAQIRVGLLSNMCHASASLAWSITGGWSRIVTGYALSDDGLWRQHSWGLQARRVVEFAGSRVAYFGFELSMEEAKRFGGSDFTGRLAGPSTDDFDRVSPAPRSRRRS